MIRQGNKRSRTVLQEAGNFPCTFEGLDWGVLDRFPIVQPDGGFFFPWQQIVEAMVCAETAGLAVMKHTSVGVEIGSQAFQLRRSKLPIGVLQILHKLEAAIKLGQHVGFPRLV